MQAQLLCEVRSLQRVSSGSRISSHVESEEITECQREGIQAHLITISIAQLCTCGKRHQKVEVCRLMLDKKSSASKALTSGATCLACT